MMTGISPSALFGSPQLRIGRVTPVQKTGARAADPASADSQTSQAELEQQPAIQELKRADTSVRQHEAAHQSAGGSYAGSASFTYTRGPDGKNYATAGEVPVDTSPEQDPSATIRKMDAVKAAALAPADPSSQDLRVAQQAESEKTKAQQQQNKAQANAAPALAARGAAAYASAYGLGQTTSRGGIAV